MSSHALGESGPLVFESDATARGEELYREHQLAVASRTDLLFSALLLAEWIAGVIVALTLTPLTWSGPVASIHPHVWLAILLGGAICGPSALLAYARRGRHSTRYVVACAQMLFSSLLIHLSGGRIETHFHIFGSLAFLAFYRDWKVLVPATIIVAADHFIRGMYFPASIFGSSHVSHWRWVEHTGWVLFEDAFLVVSCLRGTSEMRQISNHTAQLEAMNDRVEAKVRERTAELSESEELFRSLSNASPTGVLRVAMDGQCAYANDRWRQLTGATGGASLKSDWLDAFEPSCRDAVRELLRVGTSGDFSPVVECELRPTKAMPGRRWVQARARSIGQADSQHALLGHVVTVEETTGRRMQEEALRLANHELSASVKQLERASHEMAALNELGEMLQTARAPAEAHKMIANAGRRLFPTYSGSICLINGSRNLLESVVAWGDETVGEAVFSPDDCWALRRGREYLLDELAGSLPCAHVNPGAKHGGTLCLPLLAQGETLGILHLRGARDAGEDDPAAPWISPSTQRLAATFGEHISLALANLALRERLRQMSIIDPLTKLFNRRYLEETLERELRRSERSEQPVGVMMIDIDHFKLFNDTLGHEAGDALLKELGSLLRSSCRKEDIACRYGGEEFTMILPSAELGVVVARAEQLCKLARAMEVRYRGEPLKSVTLSIGVSIFPDHGSDYGTLIRVADATLYKAKHQGRDRVVVGASTEGGEAPARD